MAKRRDRLQVIYDILRVIGEKEGKVKPTHILYKSNLSHQMMKEYLKELIENEMILERRLERGKTYFLTKKGRDYLNKYKFIQEFSSSFGLE